MSRRIPIWALAALSAALALPCIAAKPSANNTKTGPTTYRWVDENGVVHYGDRVPAQYSQRESTILNREGVEIGRLQAQKTPEQLAEEDSRNQEVQRQKQHDAFLMTTYTSVADIERLRDERLGTMHAQRLAAEQYVETVHSRLAMLQTRAMMFKPYNPRIDARRMPDELAEDLVRELNEMRVQQGVIATKDVEEATLRKQFQGDIDRYKELRSARVTR